MMQKGGIPPIGGGFSSLGIYPNLMKSVALSATARPFRYCKAVLFSPTSKSTIRVRILPKMPQVQMIGQMAQYRTVFRMKRE